LGDAKKVRSDLGLEVDARSKFLVWSSAKFEVAYGSIVDRNRTVTAL